MLNNFEMAFAYVILSIFVAMLFALPAHLPRIKQKALMNYKWRWRLIVLLASLPLLLFFFVRLQTVPIDEFTRHCALKAPVTSCEEVFGINWVELSLNRSGSLGNIIIEMRGHYTFWDNSRCVTDDTVACEAVTHWLTNSQIEKSSLLPPSVLIFTLFTSFMTGCIVYRITDDKNRKEKQKNA